MNELDIFLKKFVKQLNDDNPNLITAEMEFRNLESWDSLASVMVEDMIKSNYNVTLEEDDILSVNSISELFSLVIKKQNRE